MEEPDAMKITGHQTAHVFRHYDLGDIEVLRKRLANSRTYAGRLLTTPKVRSLRPRDSGAKRRVAQ
jgi:hypothetical protein